MLNTSSIAEQQSLVAPYKIILLGKSTAGKTKLLVRYLYGSYTDMGITTMMIDCTYKTRENVKYAYFDTVGQQCYRSILNLHFKGSDAAVLIYSVNDTKSYEELSYYYKKVKEQLPKCLIYIIGCKNDLQTTVPQQLVQKNYVAKNYFLTSAKADEGINEAFLQIEKDLLLKSKTVSGIKLSTKQFSTRHSIRKQKQNQCCK